MLSKLINSFHVSKITWLDCHQADTNLHEVQVMGWRVSCNLWSEGGFLSSPIHYCTISSSLSPGRSFLTLIWRGPHDLNWNENWSIYIWVIEAEKCRRSTMSLAVMASQVASGIGMIAGAWMFKSLMEEADNNKSMMGGGAVPMPRCLFILERRVQSVW